MQPLKMAKKKEKTPVRVSSRAKVPRHMYLPEASSPSPCKLGIMEARSQQVLSPKKLKLNQKRASGIVAVGNKKTVEKRKEAEKVAETKAKKKRKKKTQKNEKVAKAKKNQGQILHLACFQIELPVHQLFTFCLSVLTWFQVRVCDHFLFAERCVIQNYDKIFEL
jgi:hypothetical protein